MRFKVWIFDGINSRNGIGFAFSDNPPYVDILVGSQDSQIYGAKIGCGADSMEWLRKELKRVADSGNVPSETIQTIWDTFTSKCLMLYFKEVTILEELSNLAENLFPSESSR